MAWLIMRIETFEARTRTTTPDDIVARIAKRHRNFEPEMKTVGAHLAAAGWELKNSITFGGKNHVIEWPFIVYVYVSPNQEGRGRGCSSLHRWAVRRSER